MDMKTSHNIHRSILYRACLQFARVGFFAALVCLCYWVLYFGSRFYSDDDYWAPSEIEIVYGCKDALLAPSCAAQELLHYNVVFLWLAPTVLALAATAMLILQPLASHPHSSTGRVWLQRLLPPRAFWLYWCGGLTVQDALLIAFWAAANAVWLSAILNRSFNTLLPYRLAMYGLKYPTHSIRAKTVARAFGSLLAPNLVMLFYPVSRGSVVLQALNISYPAAIRYHRWLGHATLTFVLLHGGMYWSAFLYDGVWVRAALSRDDDVNHLMGSIGFVFAMCLWLSALEVVRRKSYTVFKTMHHIGFWGFLVCGCCHYWGLVWYFLPGLMLYAVDGVYRLHQFALGSSASTTLHGSAKSNSQLTAFDHPTTSGSPRGSSDSQFELSHQSNNRSSAVQILHADVSPDGSMCTVVLHIPQFAAALNGFVWLCVPEINWFAYHPYTYVAVPWQIGVVQNAAGKATTATGGACLESVTAVVLHIKGYNKWSKKLVALVGDRGTNISVKVQGPYAELPGPVTGHNSTTSASPSNAKKQKLPDAVVIVAGGNGVTEAFSVLSELSALPTGLPVLLIWSSRLRGELECLTPRVISMAQAAGVQLTLKLYYTGSTALLLKDTPNNSPTNEFSDTLAIKIDAAPSSNFSAFEGSFISATTSNNQTLSTLNSASRSSQSSSSTSDSAEATSPTGVETVAAQATGGGLSSGQLDGVPAGAANDGCEDHFVTSSLCPVVALGSYWGTAGYKMILHMVMLTGAFCALLLARYLTIILPSNPLPTDQMGAIHLALIITFMLIPGLIILWASLLITKRSSKRSSQKQSNITHHVGVPGVGMCAPAVGMCAPAVGRADAAAAAMAGTVRRGVVAKLLPSVPNSPPTTKASGAVIGAGCRSPLQLLVSQKSSSPNANTSEHAVIAVDVGRPPTPQLVKGWLASIKQLPKALAANEPIASSTSTNNGVEGDACGLGSADTNSASVNCVVYAMGPPALVAGVQLLCDDVNRQAGCGVLCGSRSQKQNVRLQFVRKTHEF